MWFARMAFIIGQLTRLLVTPVCLVEMKTYSFPSLVMIGS